MPVMTGIEFYEQLMARDPAPAGRVACMSGGAVTTGTDEAFLCSVPNPPARQAVRGPRDPVAGRPDARRGKPGRRVAHRVGGILSGRVSV
jgi:hypothetical protein